MVLNETKLFIDIVTERKEIQQRDIDLLEVSLNQYGSAYEAQVEFYKRDNIETGPEDVQPMYYRGYIEEDKPTVMTMRDGVKVNVREVGARSSIYKVVVGFFRPPLEFSLMGTVK